MLQVLSSTAAASETRTYRPTASPAIRGNDASSACGSEAENIARSGLQAVAKVVDGMPPNSVPTVPELTASQAPIQSASDKAVSDRA